MNFIFTRTGSLACRAIRAIDDGNWSHCAVQTLGGEPGSGLSARCIEAVWGDGVHDRRVDSLLQDRPDHLVVDTPLPEERLAHLFLLSQKGKPYDWPAIPALAVRRVFGTAPRIAIGSWWYCAELLLGACEAGGYPIDGPLRRYGVQAALLHVLKRARSVTPLSYVR